MNLDSLSLEELQALRAQKMGARQVTKDDSFLDSMKTGLKKRGAGVIELGLKLGESLGADVKPYREDLADLQQRYQAEGEGTGFWGGVGEALGDPLTYLPIGGGATNVVKGLAGQGVLSGLTTSTGDAESDLTDSAINAAIQGGTGMVAGKVGQKLIKPATNQLDDVAAKNVALLQSEGVSLQPSQKLGSKALNLAEEAFKNLPFTASKQAKIGEKQLQQFTQAALKRAGVKADLATPDVIANAGDKFSRRFGLLTKKTGVKIDDELLNTLAEVEGEATKRLGTDSSRLVNSYVNDILESGGIVSGEVYQNTRSNLGRIAKGSSDPFTAGLLKQMQGALDDAAFRSLPAKTSKAWQRVRQQYAAYKTIDKAMTSTGDAAVSGLITPANLLNATKVGNKQFARGGGQLADLARAGKDIISSTLPDSGTATRQMMQNALTGGALATTGGIALGSIPAAAAALATPKILQEIYNTPAAKKYITEGLTDSALPAIMGGKAAISGMMQSEDMQQPEQPIAPTPMDLDSMSLEQLQELRNQRMQQPPALPEVIPDTPLSQNIQENEGLRVGVYPDTEGNPTVGYGFNFNSGIARNVWKEAGIKAKFDDVLKGRDTVTPDEARQLGIASQQIAIRDAFDLYPRIAKLSPNQQEALKDLSYNMGKPRLMSFREMNKAINEGDMRKAVVQLMRSEYAKQVPNRARKVAKLLLS